MKKATLYIDLAFCFILLPLVIYAFPVERWWGTNPLFFGSFVLWLYVTYFLYGHFIVPGLFAQGRKRMVALATMLASLAVNFLFASYEITSPLYQIHQQQRELSPYPIWGIRQNQQAVWLHYILVVIFCFAVGMLREAYRAELALYKAQINPHFLFNTLNTIYGLLITRSDKTEATMERFIDLTKYMYSNAKREFIPLAEEVQYIGEYIELQRLRLNELADIRFEHEVEREDVPLAPMILITFVENAFKYGISSDEPCYIHIRLDQHSDRLRFEVENKCFGREVKDSGGTGIQNCRRRLELTYPRCHRLVIEQGDVFRVRLEIRLKKGV